MREEDNDEGEGGGEVVVWVGLDGSEVEAVTSGTRWRLSVPSSVDQLSDASTSPLASLRTGGESSAWPMVLL